MALAYTRALLKLSGEALGAFLRREGLHEAQLTSWRDAAAGALQGSYCSSKRDGTGSAGLSRALLKFEEAAPPHSCRVRGTWSRHEEDKQEVALEGSRS